MTASGKTDRFAVLDIAPTLDLAAIKRGYFAALQRHPPHLDPEGFRHIREAYEVLSREEGLFAAYMASQPDVGAALAELEATIGQELSRLAEVDARQQGAAAATRAAVDLLTRLSFSEAMKAFGT